jgi:hypothetical protein
MRLYKSRRDLNRWYAYSECTGWVTFEDTDGSWERRQTARDTFRRMFGAMQASLRTWGFKFGSRA